MITRKQIKLATDLISPEAGKALATFRTKSRGHKTAYRTEKAIKTEVRLMQIHPCFSSASPVFNKVTLPVLDFMALTDKYEVAE